MATATLSMMPEIGDRAVYMRADNTVRVIGTVKEIFGNGRIKFVPDKNPDRWMSLSRRFQKRIAGEQYGLTLIES